MIFAAASAPRKAGCWLVYDLVVDDDEGADGYSRGEGRAGLAQTGSQ